MSKILEILSKNISKSKIKDSIGEEIGDLRGDYVSGIPLFEEYTAKSFELYFRKKGIQLSIPSLFSQKCRTLILYNHIFEVKIISNLFSRNKQFDSSIFQVFFILKDSNKVVFSLPSQFLIQFIDILPMVENEDFGVIIEDNESL